MSGQDDGRPSRIRGVVTIALAVLTALALTLSTTAVWVKRTTFETDRFMELVEPTLTDDEVVSILAARITDATLEALALDERLEDVLADVQSSIARAIAETLGVPDGGQDAIDRLLEDRGLTQLAPPLAAAVEDRVAEAVDELVRSDDVQALVVEAVRRAHTQAVLLLRGEYDELPAVVVEQGTVALDLRPFVDRVLTSLTPDVLQSIGLADLLDVEDPDEPLAVLEALYELSGRELDPSFARIPVWSEEELNELQALVVGMDRAVWWMVVATVLLFVATLGTARDWRRGLWAVTIAAVVGLGLGAALVGRVVDRIVAVAVTPEEQAAVLRVADATVGSLRDVLLVVCSLAGLVLLLQFAALRRSRHADPVGGS